MKPEDKDKDPRNPLDRIVSEIRTEPVDPGTVEESAARVWERISGSAAVIPPEIGTIRGCADIQALLPAYLAGTLPGPRALLVEDHTRECLPCRRALQAARAVPATKAASAPAPGRPMPAALRWGVAATVLVALGLGVLAVREWGFPGTDGLARAEEVHGTLLRVAGDAAPAVPAGGTVRYGDAVRTARDSGALVRLAEGSLVEMRERSEIAVSRRGADTTVRLTRGSVIVQAAPQGKGHLYVRTDDCLVAVTGTVFSVTSGTKGSRVSVLEGEVRCQEGGKESVLTPGEQLTTQPGLAQVPVEEEIAWSRHLQRHLALLRELQEVQKEIQERLPLPAQRTSTRLLDLAPPGTVFYAAIPNLSEHLAEGSRLLRERIETNPVLKAWWEEGENRHRIGEKIDEVVGRIREVGELVGDEVVVTLALDGDEWKEGPLFLAEVERPDSLRAVLERLAREEGPALRVLGDLSGAGASNDDHTLRFWIRDGILAGAFDSAPLYRLAAVLDAPGENAFRTSPFHARLAEDYREGAGLLFAADLQTILARKTAAGADAEGTATALRLGLLDVRHVIFETRQEGETVRRSVDLTFTRARRGIASWLSPPAPIGSLEFVSPDANLVTSFVVREPGSLLRELIEATRQEDGVRDLESEKALRILQEIAAPLGGDVTFAIDGPVLPTPSWKVVVELYDPPFFQRAIESLLAEVNEGLREKGKAEIRLQREEAAGRVGYAILPPDGTPEVHYAFVDGYLVVAPRRVLIERAVELRDAGLTLPRSPGFEALLPRDGHVDFSAIGYQNFAPILGPIAEKIAGPASPLALEQRQAIQALGADSLPSLAVAYAEPDRIRIESSGPGGLFGGDLTTLISLDALFEAQRNVQDSVSRGRVTSTTR